MHAASPTTPARSASDGALRDWATIERAAEHYGVSRSSIRRWIDAGLIHAERMGPRLIRVDLYSLQGQALRSGSADDE